MKLTEFRTELENLLGRARRGCGDGACQVDPKTGLVTNGGCRCRPRDFADALRGLADLVERDGRHRPWS